jgi:ATP-dependent helicase HrpA
MLLQALDEGCVEEVAVLASALSLQDPRERPIEKAKEADEAHRAFRDAHSDFAGLLNIRNAYERSRRTLKSQSRLRSWCRENFLSFSRMREWCDIHRQILAILEEHGLKARSVQTEGPAETRYAPIHRAVLAGYLANIATKKDKNLYTAARGREVMVFPGSGLFNRGHDWIVAAEMVKTTRLFARTLARIDPAWLEPLGGHLCKSTVSGPYWSRERGEVLASQRISLYGLVIVESRPVPYARIHPEEAHAIFIRSALVEGNVRERFPFLVHNQALAEKIQGLEDKLRRRDLLVSEEAIHDFYAKRLPGISDTRTLKRRIREMGGDAFLRMDETDLVAQTPDTGRLEEYPDKLVTGGISFPLSYRFAPGKEEDGVTVSIPSGLVSAFPPERLDWVIPGLFEEKIMALIKGLPKTYRKRLVPASETAKVIAREMERSDEPLASALSRFLYRRFGVDVPAALWEEVRIPDHLRMRVALKEPDGKEVGAGRDPGILKGPAGTKVAGAMASKALGEARRTWERSGITSWEFGDLPDRVNVEESLTVYPCLEPAEDGVNLRLYTDRKAATATHRRGVERLFVQCLGGELKFLKKALRWPETANEAARLLGGARTLENALLEAAVRRLFSVDIRTAEAFRAHAEAVKPNLIPEGSALMGHALKVAQAYSQARSVVEGIEKANRTHRAVLDVCAEMRAELDRLVPRHFLEIYDNDRLAHLPRYLKAIEIRATRGAHAVERDRAKAKEAARFLEAYERIRSALSPLATEEKRKAIEDYRWMVEEFKVSLFAQELKTPFPVSAKRLEQRLAEIERMV